MLYLVAIIFNPKLEHMTNEQKPKKKIPFGAFFVLGVFGFILIFSIFHKTKPYERKDETTIKMPASDEIFALAQKQFESGEYGLSKININKIYKDDVEFIKREDFKNLNDRVDSVMAVIEAVDIKNKVDLAMEELGRFDIDNVTVLNITQKVYELEGYMPIIYKAQSHNDNTKKYSRKLINKLRSTQMEFFPKLRRKYGELADANLWEYDMDVRVIGSKSDRIQLIGAKFAANRNIKEFQEGVGPLLTKLRFKRVDYKWIPSASDYESFMLNADTDSYMMGVLK